MKLEQYDPSELIQTFCFDPEEFDFRKIYREHLADAFGNAAIEEFHKAIPSAHMPKDAYEGTAQNYGHEILYAIDPAFRQANHVSAKDRGFASLYRRFMKFVQDEIFGEPVIYQRMPSLRIHYPGYSAGGIMHRDSEFNHPAEEINMWLPITPARGSASMIIESEVDKGDYQPVELEFGQFIIFDSALVHGNVINNEGYTRLSFDMRIIPQSTYSNTLGTYSATAGKAFCIGDYYERFEA